MRCIKFEIFNRPAMNAAIQVVLFLYAYSRTTSIVIVGRHRGARLLPTLEGYALLFDFLQVHLAGNDLTENLIKILFERDLSFATTAGHGFKPFTKNKLAYILGFDFKIKVAKEILDKEKAYEFLTLFNTFLQMCIYKSDYNQKSDG